jgi:hypothetical protein
MKTFSRRDVLKTSLLAPAVVATAHAIGPVDPVVRRRRGFRTTERAQHPGLAHTRRRPRTPPAGLWMVLPLRECQ